MAPRPAPATLAEFIEQMPSGEHFSLTWSAGTPQLVLLDLLWDHHLIQLIRHEYEVFSHKGSSYQALLVPPFVVELVEWFASWGSEAFRYADGEHPEFVALGEIPSWVNDAPRYAALVAAAHSLHEPDLPDLARVAAEQAGVDVISLLNLVLDIYSAAGGLDGALDASLRALTVPLS